MRHRLLHAAVGAAGAIVVGGTLVAIPANAGSTGVKPVTTCGTQITSKGHWALMNDIGPCTGDGIDIMVNSVTLSLNGHTITGNDMNNTSDAGGTNFATNPPSPIPGNSEQIGIAVMGAHGVKVSGPGTVTAFDAGVDVMGGSGNTVTGLTAQGNIAHVLLIPGVTASNTPCAGGTVGCMWNPALPGPLSYPCNDGDGILTDGSNGNSLTNNNTYGNGPFDGIALVGPSSDNTVSGNNSHDQAVSNIIPAYPASEGGPGTDGPCGPFSAAAAGPGRPHQDIGIRIEGPGATYNVVSGNTSMNNQLEGISIHDNVCPGVFPGFNPPPNVFNTVENNTVSGNGFADGTDGIAILQQGPLGVVCVPSNNSILNNTSTGNARDGVYVGGRTASGNVVSGNTVTGNGKDGVELQGGSVNSSGTYVPGAENDTVSGNTANSNAHDGIEVDTGAFSNTISGNSAHSNTTFDGADDNTTPACDSNSWSGDSFGTVSQSCVS